MRIGDGRHGVGGIKKRNYFEKYFRMGLLPAKKDCNVFVTNDGTNKRNDEMISLLMFKRKPVKFQKTGNLFVGIAGMERVKLTRWLLTIHPLKWSKFYHLNECDLRSVCFGPVTLEIFGE